jgi:hypothetical protein
VYDDEILHVIVGHGLPTQFLNTLGSFRAICPDSQLLVIDNRSPQESLRAELRRRAGGDPHMELLLRESNASSNPREGALHSAYEIAFERARSGGYRYVHLLQADMQVMFWDQELLDQIAQIYERHPNCVNVYTCALSSDRTMMGDIVVDETSGDATLPEYAMTDTGIFDLERWDRAAMEMLADERAMAKLAASRGLQTFVSAWPTEIQVPWPAVVRNGKQIGHEVPLRKPFLCVPLDADAVAALKSRTYPASLEDMCVPWGWWCLSPMYVTDTSHWYYLNFRRRDVMFNGLREGFPRLVTSGLESRSEMFLAPHRPGLARLLLWPLPSLALELAGRATRGRWGNSLEYPLTRDA